MQTYFAKQATYFLSKKLDTKVNIEKVEVVFFNKARFVNFYLEDLNKDTLISAGSLDVSFSVFDLIHKTINVSAINLNQAVVHIHRDSIGLTNITEVFKKLATQPSTVDTTKKKFDWKLDLSEVALHHTDFRYWDVKGNVDVKVWLPFCEIELDKLALDKKLIAVETALLDSADVEVDLLKHAPTPSDDSIMHVQFMLGGLTVTFEKFALTNTTFRLEDFNRDSLQPKGMDFKHIGVREINLFAENGTIVGDSIVGHIKNLSAKERCGFILNSFTADARVSVNDIDLQNLHIVTPHSDIKDYLNFRFDAFHYFKDFLNGVYINANLKNSKIALNDLNHFVRKLDKLQHNKFIVSGKINGKVNNLKGNNIDIRTAQNTVFKGDFATRGLPNIYETSLNLRVKRLATTVKDVQLIYPGIKFPANLNNLGIIYYTGALDGFLTDFVSDGKFVTALGSATTDVNFKYDKQTNKASYKGELALNEFDLAKFFNDEKNLGKISLNTKINGGGLTLESLRAEIDGTVTSITLKGYEYKNVKVDGYVLRKSFNGLVKVHDPYLDVDFNGRADLSKTVPEFKFDADIQRALLKPLHLSLADFRVAGKVRADFAGTKVDDFIGALDLRDIALSRDTITAKIRQLHLDAILRENQKKEIRLNSDFAEAELEGNFTVKELPRSLISFAKLTFTKDYLDTSKTSPQNFKADIRIYEPGKLTQIIHPKFTLIRNSHVSGSFNSVDHHVDVTAFVPEVEFADYNAKRINLNTNFENGFFDFRTTVDKVYKSDSLMLDTLDFTSRTLENKDVRFDISVADKQKYNYANVTAFLTPLKGQAVVRLEPSDVKLANYHWSFDKNNSIFIEGKKIVTNNLAFRTKDQTIYISSYLKNDTSTCVKMTLANTDISDFTGIFTEKIKDMHGALNGKLIVEDVFYKPQVFADIVADEFTIGGELVGDVNIESKLDESGKNILLYASVKSAHPNSDYRNFLEAKGYISIDPAKPGMKIDLNAEKLGLNFLNYRFFDKYVKNCRGYAKINAQILGTLKKPLLLGDVTLMNDTVTVSFLNTTYHIHNFKAKLDEHGFDFGSFSLYDMRDSVIYASGRINHESFKFFSLDLQAVTPNGQFINTTEKQSPGFYGIAYGKGNVTFSGPINNPVIRAYAQTKPGTYCRLPIRSTFETNKYSFYKFVDKNEKVSIANVVPQLKLNGVNFVLELDATSDARMDIILDPTTGDVLTGYGSGNLKIEIPRNGNTVMYGNYEIERGSYLFTLQNIVNKKFEIKKGGTVSFNGEIYKAGLNIDAIYELRSSVNDLIVDLITDAQAPVSSNQNLLQSAARSRVPVQLTLNLTGVLEKPTIGFDIKAIDVDPTIKGYVEQKLALLKQNDNEMNKQVFGLLVMNRFIPAPTSGASTSVGNYVGGTAANTVSEFVSSQLNNYLNNLIDYGGSDALKNFDINIGYSQYDQSTLQYDANGSPVNPSNDTRREVKLALQQRLLNNRLTINAGGNLDFGNSTVVDNSASQSGQSGSRSVIPTGDFQIQYALTPDGRWSAKAFNRTNYDYYNSRNTNKTGIGISYKQEFDKPSELLVKRKKKKKKQ